MGELKTFWSWSGLYVGYRLSDGLFNHAGRQIGYFAEGDEVYGCNGDYLGEVRHVNRLIMNVYKKAWKRKSFSPLFHKSFPGHPNVDAKEIPEGFEDFLASEKQI